MQTFIERFSKVALKIINLNPEFVLHYMITTLKLGPFADNLCMIQPTSRNEVEGCHVYTFGGG